jgi:hypothetical protein
MGKSLKPYGTMLTPCQLRGKKKLRSKNPFDLIDFIDFTDFTDFIDFTDFKDPTVSSC